MARTNDIFLLKTQDPHPGISYHIIISGGLLAYFFCDIFNSQLLHERFLRYGQKSKIMFSAWKISDFKVHFFAFRNSFFDTFWPSPVVNTPV